MPNDTPFFPDLEGLEELLASESKPSSTFAEQAAATMDFRKPLKPASGLTPEQEALLDRGDPKKLTEGLDLTKEASPLTQEQERLLFPTSDARVGESDAGPAAPGFSDDPERMTTAAAKKQGWIKRFGKWTKTEKAGNVRQALMDASDLFNKIYLGIDTNSGGKRRAHKAGEAAILRENERLRADREERATARADAATKANAMQDRREAHAEDMEEIRNTRALEAGRLARTASFKDRIILQHYNDARRLGIDLPDRLADYDAVLNTPALAAELGEIMSEPMKADYQARLNKSDPKTGKIQAEALSQVEAMASLFKDGKQPDGEGGLLDMGGGLADQAQKLAASPDMTADLLDEGATAFAKRKVQEFDNLIAARGLYTLAKQQRDLITASIFREAQAVFIDAGSDAIAQRTNAAILAEEEAKRKRRNETEGQRQTREFFERSAKAAKKAKRRRGGASARGEQIRN